MPKPPVTKVVSYVQTDVGMVREHNEDSCYADDSGAFFIVADGMGGHAAGEVASSMAVEAVKTALLDARDKIDAFTTEPGDDGRQELVQILEDAVKKAHQAVFERGGRETDKRGMGTTLEVVLLADGEAFVAHVGDSRTYLVRGNEIAKVTTDHTVAEVLVIEGKLSPEEARLSPLRTILVNAIGVSPDVGVELAHLKLRRGDKVLLCSDGMHDYFPVDRELAELLEEAGGQEGLDRLVELAKERGGHDNITGVLVEVVEGHPSLEEEEAQAKKAAEELALEQTDEDRAAVPTSLGSEPTAPLQSEGAPSAGNPDDPPDGKKTKAARTAKKRKPSRKKGAKKSARNKD